MLELDHVGFSYGKRLILDNASALFKEGSTTAIMGPSGSGKTTLLRLMDGSLQPDTGSVTIDGANVNSIDRKNFSDLYACAYFRITGSFHILTCEKTSCWRLKRRIRTSDKPRLRKLPALRTTQSITCLKKCI
ncbi:ABC transporter ATP-binding protein [Bifidobacterium pseudocatenulatum]|uniref:ATP-binding cassette domain-containing protein n=1 Tax=Bifidobacterium pseudocatenulatum TaxID=28026 RepID=UPI000E513BDF|nr:ABC transporter ATP-binding protein [Bifidobacterium pseudocatenulatum]